MQFIVFVLLLALSLAYGFAPTGLSAQRAPTQRCGSIKMMNHIDILAKMPTLLTALEEAKPDDYQYGAVNAPSFVLPLTAFAVIAFAAIPFLLAPGEEALEQQRRDEQERDVGFNKRDGKDLR